MIPGQFALKLIIVIFILIIPVATALAGHCCCRDFSPGIFPSRIGRTAITKRFLSSPSAGALSPLNIHLPHCPKTSGQSLMHAREQRNGSKKVHKDGIIAISSIKKPVGGDRIDSS